MDGTRVGLDSDVAMTVAEAFILSVQFDPPADRPGEWVHIGGKLEHAEWIRPATVETVLGEVLSYEAAEKTLATDDEAVALQVGRATGQYVALVDSDRRLVGVATRGPSAGQPARDGLP
jgi:hypothetical protein